MAMHPLIKMYQFPETDAVVSMEVIYMAAMVPKANAVITGIVHFDIVLPISIALATIKPKKKLHVKTASFSSK